LRKFYTTFDMKKPHPDEAQWKTRLTQSDVSVLFDIFSYYHTHFRNVFETRYDGDTADHGIATTYITMRTMLKAGKGIDVQFAISTYLSNAIRNNCLLFLKKEEKRGEREVDDEDIGEKYMLDAETDNEEDKTLMQQIVAGEIGDLSQWCIDCYKTMQQKGANKEDLYKQNPVLKPESVGQNYSRCHKKAKALFEKHKK